MNSRDEGIAAISLSRLAWRHRGVLSDITAVELEKRYAGSVLGRLWLLLHPLFLLLIYLFVYLAVFRMKLPGYAGIHYALFVFCGLIPFIGLSEALSSGSMCIKQNMHLVKNVMLPIELVPVRSVLSSLATQSVGLLLLLALLVAAGHGSWKLSLLPLVIALQVLFLVGVVLVLSSVAVAIADLGYFVNLLVMLLFFVSPIGFTREMVPAPFDLLVDLNPVTYLVDAYRTVLLAEYSAGGWSLASFGVISIVSYVAGAAFFARFKGVLVDYE